MDGWAGQIPVQIEFKGKEACRGAHANKVFSPKGQTVE